MEIIKKELSEKNLKAIANLIMDSKNYILPQMQIINTFIHSVRITTILFVRTLFGQRVFKLDFFAIFQYTLKKV
jgi:hypothetical protein